ncbi:MAG: sensor histidine kinase [Gemmatimonas sp.]
MSIPVAQPPVRKSTWSSVTPRLRWLLLAFWIMPALVSLSGVWLVRPIHNLDMSYAEAFVAYGLAWMTWALWVPVILWYGDRLPIELSRWRTLLVAHVLGSVVVGAAQVFLFMFVLRAFRLFDPAWGPSSLFSVGLRYYAGAMLVVYWAIVGAHAAIRMHAAYREQAMVATKLEADLVGAQLHTLQSQLNPHFLFNSLNSVVTLMARDTAGAQRMLVRLSELLRATLAAGDESEVQLRQEIELVERYLEIERIRFGNRLSVAIDVDPALERALVPALFLQPLVENAITHGISQINGAATVSVSARGSGDVIAFEVRDNGPGPNAKAKRPGQGIGVSNLQQRLERMYGPGFSVELGNAPTGGCVATVRLPALNVAPQPIR